MAEKDTSPPEVTIYGAGMGMQAVGFIEDGKVVSVEVTDHRPKLSY